MSNNANYLNLKKHNQHGGGCAFSYDEGLS